MNWPVLCLAVVLLVNPFTIWALVEIFDTMMGWS